MRFLVFLMLLSLAFIYAQEATETPKPEETKKEVPKEEAPKEDVEIILLKNGDRITGKISKFEDDKIVFVTQLGEINIPWEQVQGLESSRILYFRMENEIGRDNV